MKELPLLSKTIPSMVCPYCARGLPEKAITLKSSELLKGALEIDPENRKGLQNIRRALKIMDAIEQAEANGGASIELEDSEFESLCKSVDQTEWLPVALKFNEFFESIEAAKK